MSFLPITSKLNPLGGAKNLAYLAEIAALTRMATGVVRVMQNQPEKLHDPRLRMNEKRQAFWERFFVEILGTAGYVFFLHLGQDLTSKVLEAKTKLPFLTENAKTLSKREIEATNRAIADVFGKDSKDLICRVLYGKPVTTTAKDGQIQTLVRKANLTALRERLIEELGEKGGNELFGKARPYLDGFARKANKLACGSILGGVALSALYGGLVTQWLNDRVVAPFIQRRLKKRFGGAVPAPTPNASPSRAMPPRNMPPAMMSVPTQPSAGSPPLAPTPPLMYSPNPAAPPSTLMPPHLPNWPFSRAYTVSGGGT